LFFDNTAASRKLRSHKQLQSAKPARKQGGGSTVVCLRSLHEPERE
jgi:hypothetical protein